MSRNGTESANGATAWLPPEPNGNGRNGNGRNGHRRNGNGQRAGDVDQWLVDMASAREAQPRPLRDRHDRGRNPRERWLASRLRRAREKLHAQDALIEELRERVVDLERNLQR
jgi:hypothetical protein